jgi:hypothetical protein
MPVTSHILRLCLASSLAATLCFASASSRADVTKDQCVDANAKGQDLRRVDKLSAAREQFLHCALPSCPVLVRDDCTKRLDELESAQPSIVFDAKDGSGRDVSGVRVTVDGRPAAEKLDGTALQVDPGEHVFVFAAADQTPVTQSFVIKEGDKERRERIVIGAAALAMPPPSSEPASVQPTGGQESDHGMRSRRILGYGVGAIGVGGIAAGTVFAVMAASEATQQQKDCGNPSCSAAGHMAANTDHSTGEMDRTISIVSFAAGGALLVGGAILVITGGRPVKPSTSTGMLLLPTLRPGGGEMLLMGEF